MKPPIAGPHLVRYGTAADQKYLVNEFLTTYDQLIVNANIVAHMPSAITTFISQHARSKPFLIDPQTHAFQHDLSFLESQSEEGAGQLRRSISRLVEEYGNPVADRIAKRRSVLPSNFEHRKTREQFCERVLRFQYESIESQARESPTSKYFKYLEKKGLRSPSAARPTAVVAPYFYLAPTTYDEWLKVNIDCANDSIEIAKSLKAQVAIQVVVSKDVLAEDALLAEILKQYRTLTPSVFLLWIDDFTEHAASRRMLDKFIWVLDQLGERAPVVNLYGGYFSIALLRSRRSTALLGVSHGLEYGESRAVTPVGGGIPVAKYYLPALHDRLAFRDAFRAVRALGGLDSVSAFHDRVCGCNQCRRVIEKDPASEFSIYGRSKPLTFYRGHQVVRREFPLPETRDNSVRHYLWCKHREFSGAFDGPVVADQLVRTAQTLARVLGLESVAYCNIWADSITGDGGRRRRG